MFNAEHQSKNPRYRSMKNVPCVQSEPVRAEGGARNTRYGTTLTSLNHEGQTPGALDPTTGTLAAPPSPLLSSSCSSKASMCSSSAICVLHIGHLCCSARMRSAHPRHMQQCLQGRATVFLGWHRQITQAAIVRPPASSEAAAAGSSPGAAFPPATG